MREFTIFVTGAAVLALELIASRVMAPYFGVSLYIWTGILSITLLCLAFGYYLGGRYARGRAPAEMRGMFYLLTAIAGIAIGNACWIYPLAFGPLARFDLLAGSFVASVILLAVPLVALSALNPLLVAIQQAARGQAAAHRPRHAKEAVARPAGDDAGAGRVFFISTLGSVAGALIAALYLIPNWSNLVSIVLVAAGLAALALCGALVERDLPAQIRRWIFVFSAAALGLAVALATIKGREGGRTMAAPGGSWSIVASVPSAFGNIKVVDLAQGDDKIRLLLNDGLVQNRVQADGRSISFFTHALDDSIARLVPDPRRVLVLGLGAGIVAGAAAKRGAMVDVVEINPRMIDVAKAHFGYRPGGETTIAIADARTAARDCRARYDAAFVDLYFGDGIPEHLLTREFMADLRACLTPRGALAMNVMFDMSRPDSFRSIAATVVAAFGAAATFAKVDSADSVTNGFIVAGPDASGLRKLEGLQPDPDSMPRDLQAGARASYRSLQIFTVGAPELRGAPILTDERNPITVLATPAQVALRRSIAATLPAALLLN